MQLTDYLTPLWVNCLITLGVCLVGGILICLGFYFGLKAGLDEAFRKKEKKKVRK